MTKDPLSARISTSTINDLEEFADEKDISKSEATDRLLDEALRVKNEEATVVITDGGTENKLETISEKVDRVLTQTELVENDTQSNRLQSVAHIIGILYIIGVATLDISSISMILIGLSIILLLVYVNLDDWRNFIGDQL
jgi:hypothetical protein